MLVLRLKILIFALTLGALGLSSCGKKSSSESPPPSAEAWDGLADDNASDLTLKDIEP